MKKKNHAPALEIMSLEFFACHFNFPQDILQWGILEKKMENEEAEVSCVVLVKDKLLYIDIADCKIRPCVNTGEVSFNRIPCEVMEFDNKFAFSSEECTVGIKKETVAEAYADKVYSEVTDKYLLGWFA